MVMSQFAPSWFQRVVSLGVSLRVIKSKAVLVKRGLTTDAASCGLGVVYVCVCVCVCVCVHVCE